MTSTQLNFLDVSGIGNSGKGAIGDFLREFDKFYVSDRFFEFDILRVPDGIIDLWFNLEKHWSPSRCDAAIKRFQKLVARMGEDPKQFDIFGIAQSTGQRLNAKFSGKFVEVSVAYLEELVKSRYRASWPYDTFYESSFRRFARKLAQRTDILSLAWSEVFVSDTPNFSSWVTRYLNSLFMLAIKPGQNFVVLNNSFEPYNPTLALDLIENSKCILVKRDPRDAYVNGLNIREISENDKRLQPSENDGHMKSFLGNSVETFCLRQKICMQKAYTGNDPRVLWVWFEDMILNYEDTKQKIMNFLNIPPSAHSRPLEIFNPSESRKNIGRWNLYSKQDEIRIIEEQLAGHLYRMPQF